MALPFDTDDPRFIEGFEMGRLWEQAKIGGDIEQPIHSRNAEMAMRIAEATNREFSAEQIDDTWTTLRLRDGICRVCGEWLMDCLGHEDEG